MVIDYKMNRYLEEGIVFKIILQLYFLLTLFHLNKLSIQEDGGGGGGGVGVL